MSLRPVLYNIKVLEPGYQNDVIGFHFKGYDNYSDRQKSDYDNLESNILRVGVTNPLITWRGHVLIGQRRLMIIKAHPDKLGHIVRCLEVDQDMSTWGHSSVSNLVGSVRRIYRDLKRGILTYEYVDEVS